MKNPILMHINCLEQGQSLEEICRKVAAWGFDGAEFRMKRHKIGRNEAPGETTDSYLDRIARGMGKNNLRQIAFGGGPILTDEPDSAKRRQQTDECIKFYRAAARRFRLSVCNVLAGTIYDSRSPAYHADRQGAAAATREQFDWIVESFRAIGEAAGELGIRLAFETHPGRYHDSAEASRRLVEAIGLENVGINLDYANLLGFGQLPPLEEVLNTCGDKLYYVHFKNAYTVAYLPYHHFPCPLADGVINTRELLRQLKMRNYAGPVTIEASRPGDREWFARQDLAYYRTIATEICKEMIS
ncbi:MAG: sugar phosphate isomerase/epimerase [Victivallaceae bacterium]|nr:sugar phosphate isomerase/epimerase [Victivallaceae bacterium]